MFPQMREVTKEMLDNLVNIITFAYSGEISESCGLIFPIFTHLTI